MSNTTNADSLRRFEIPGRAKIVQDKNGLWKVLAVTADWTGAEVYLHGAHVTDFQKKGGPPLLFLSASSQFAPGKAIRGGVPIIFPWFGNREGKPAHGFARTTEWELVNTFAERSGGVKLQFRLPSSAFEGRVEYVVTITDKLTMELIINNTSSQALTFENCLHAYFLVGDISAVTVKGLKGMEYLDKADGFVRKRDNDDVIKIASEQDRIYVNTTGAVEVHDGKLRRVIRVEKSGSASTVVWNPWAEKSKAFTDFGNEDYKRMICMESGNIGENQITLKPGEASNLKVMVGDNLMNPALVTAAGNPEDQDRAVIVEEGSRTLLCIADGSGGLSGAAEAATMAVEFARKRMASLTDEISCVQCLSDMDAMISSDSVTGETTCVLVVVTLDMAFGASVGDSGAWLFDGTGSRIDLTRGQQRKPVIGSGFACPAGFNGRRLEGSRLLLATDGLLKYTSANKISEVCVSAPVETAAQRLIELVRYSSGALPDDVTVILAQF